MYLDGVELYILDYYSGLCPGISYLQNYLIK